MSNRSFRIGAVAGCLKAPDPAATVAAARQVGLECLQVSANRPADLTNAQRVANWVAASKSSGIALASAVTGFPQERYSTIQTIAETGGLVPDDVADRNVQIVADAIEFAKAAGIPLLTFHAGFIPEDPASPVFGRLLGRLDRCAEAAAARGVRIALESGQETAGGLKRFLTALNRPNVGVNFDPANLILYGRQNPLEAVDLLGPHIFQVHAKDGTWSARPGVDWGKEVRVGTGDVNFEALLPRLASAGFAGDLIIEREAGDQPLEDIGASVTFLRGLMQ